MDMATKYADLLNRLQSIAYRIKPLEGTYTVDELLEIIEGASFGRDRQTLAEKAQWMEYNARKCWQVTRYYSGGNKLYMRNAREAATEILEMLGAEPLGDD